MGERDYLQRMRCEIGNDVLPSFLEISPQRRLHEVIESHLEEIVSTPTK
jgi:hypothetical protein